jgi:uncharacterized protein YgiM (DUF1202 family)
MRRATLALLLLTACGRPEPAQTETTETRAPIAIEYAGVPELQVHAKPDANAPVISTVLSGESVSVLAKNGEWSEVRTVSGSGFVKSSELTTAQNAKSEEENPTPKFRRAPSPVTSPGAHGTIYLEADVNTDGDITHIDIISNTTNDPTLAQKNIAALMRAKFYPIVQKGKRMAFKYDYRVDY